MVEARKVGSYGGIPVYEADDLPPGTLEVTNGKQSVRLVGLAPAFEWPAPPPPVPPCRPFDWQKDRWDW